MDRFFKILIVALPELLGLASLILFAKGQLGVRPGHAVEHRRRPGVFDGRLVRRLQRIPFAGQLHQGVHHPRSQPLRRSAGAAQRVVGLARGAIHVEADHRQRGKDCQGNAGDAPRETKLRLHRRLRLFFDQGNDHVLIVGIARCFRRNRIGRRFQIDPTVTGHKYLHPGVVMGVGHQVDVLRRIVLQRFDLLDQFVGPASVRLGLQIAGGDIAMDDSRRYLRHAQQDRRACREFGAIAFLCFSQEFAQRGRRGVFGESGLVSMPLEAL